ncbi:hypothetical protein BJX62DRAFT_229608 [Aspergillus germanicus]
MRPSSRDEFAIAIICALTLEADAVEALFDETYDRLSESYKKQSGDDNAYYNGRIGNHNVVLCLMPRMGKGNAASVAASLRISYRKIQLALVVGICGGAPCSPTKEEVFLGDVIVSDAVIEYDFGRQYRHGFKRKTGVKDTLGRPDWKIQSLLAGLQPGQSRRDLRMKMLRHLQALQELQPQWRRPSSADDVLYEPSYQHKHYSLTLPYSCLCLDKTSDDVCQTALDTPCILLGCADNRLCRRRRPCIETCKPTIHIGTVASADTGVIGFEMEGAGVWNTTSCIIIKGVCDYADSHKNKAWQGYAAATGAATAKAFLEYWEPTTSKEANDYYIPLDLAGVPAIEEFIGREEELNCLWDYLQPARSKTRKIAVLHGLGGIGKTQLAIHFARKHKVDFTAIFWLSGKDRSALVSSLSSCLPRIPGQPMDNNTMTIEEEVEQRASQVLQWLAIPGNTRWLIIFDNIDQYSLEQDQDSYGYDIYKFFPKADHGSIMITSRLQRLTELGKSFRVQRLLQSDAIRLLMQSSSLTDQDIARMGAEQDVIDLASHLDGLSLAIVMAGAFMRQTGTNVMEYLELYRTSWSDLQSLSKSTRHYQQGNIVQTWLVTYQEIQKRDPTAAKLLLLLAFFDNQDIWYELIQSGMNCSDPPTWLKEAVSSKLVFKAKLKSLIGFSLVETKQHEGSYTLHPVVQDWCSHMAAFDESVDQLHEITMISVGNMVPRNDERDYARLQQRLLPHADYLTRKERHSWREDRLDICTAWNGLGNLYLNQGKLQEAEEMYQRALAGFERALGPDHTSTLDTVSNLGNLYSGQGKLHDAEEMYQRALVGKEKGKLQEAEEMYQRALARKEKALSPGHLKTRMVSESLASFPTIRAERPRKRDMLYKILRKK